MVEQKAEECKEPEVKSCSAQTVESGDKCCRCRRERQERAEERCLALVLFDLLSFYLFSLICFLFTCFL